MEVRRGRLPGARWPLSQSQWPFTCSRCWFKEETAISALYVTVHGYFLVTFLFNIVVLGLVAWKIFTLPSATAGKKQRQNCKGALTLLGLSSLVGVTWGLAILTPLGLSTVYIFTLFNSLQGEAPRPGGCRPPCLHQGVWEGWGEWAPPRPEPLAGRLADPQAHRRPVPLTGIFIFSWFITLYFPIQSTMSSSSGPAQAEHSHTMSHE